VVVRKDALFEIYCWDCLVYYVGLDVLTHVIGIVVAYGAAEKAIISEVPCTSTYCFVS
jgi:hypothetical protein